MDNSISKILADGGIPKEIVESLQEAFDKKVAEAKSETEMSIREEFSRRYEHDKENLVEAMDRMLSDVVEKHEAEKAESVQKFVEARTAFRKAVKESRANYKAKMNETVASSRTFVAEQVAKEISKLREQKKRLVAERLKSAEILENAKQNLLSEQAKRLKKIDEFVIKMVNKELTEFNEDHRALVETRVKLVSEGRKKLRETQTRFVKEAAKNVEKVINESLKKEMAQLHEDLERNRENMFGRRIFESVAAEFMTSYLAEGTEIRKLQNVLEAKDKALAETKSKLSEAIKNNDNAQRKTKLAEDRAIRNKVLAELLSNLRGEKRVVMEGMLETVKTDSLRSTFHKLLPVVIEDNSRKAPSKTSDNSTRPATLVTGNARPNRLVESVNVEDEIDNEIEQVVRLAGLNK